MKWMPILFLLIVAASLGLRIPNLAARPMHHDEANQAYRFGTLLEEGTYAYDADDHHGPTLYYLTLPIAWLTGAESFAETTETTYRILPVIFGMLLILCTPLLRSGIGCIAVLVASLLTAISPAMAYYSRFYIQEILLVFFTLLTIAAGWLSLKSGSRGWAAVCGLSAGLMFATKETAVISYAAMFGSGLLCTRFARKPHLPLKNLLIAGACAIAVAVVLFSSFLTHPGGPLESILAFKGYFARSSGVDTNHVHPWYFYLRMLIWYRFEGGPVWSESLIFFLGLGGCLLILLKKVPANCNLGLARFLMFYTLLLTLAYSAIAYKTPWCILSFLHGWILLAGISVATGFESARRSKILSVLILVLLLAASTKMGKRALLAVDRYAADYRNPYVYAHTSPDFKNLLKRIGELEAISPKGREMHIQVISAPDATWPLPFYLRGFPNVGYWVDTAAVPSTPKPDIIVSAADFETTPDEFLTEFYGLRPDTLLAIHIDSNLWNIFIEMRK
ncbi:MAG: TIGR03663 family protein [Verrucomicrobiota bacterium]|nr:TIGR03663 family protein [Verrucomicrobiota bacterium]